MSQKFPGQVVCDIIEVKFSVSGKVAKVFGKTGSMVKRGEILASLDRSLLQAELDRELAEYERRRAEFELFVNKYPNPDTDPVKYAKIIEQSQLNISVKSVEIAKIKLDQSDLASPVDGQILSDGSNRPGLHVSPASSAYQILDYGSMAFVFEISPEMFQAFKPSLPVSVTVNGVDYLSTIGWVVPDGKKFKVSVPLSGVALAHGMPGEVSVETGSS